jgi:predicted transcriptional regulator
MPNQPGQPHPLSGKIFSLDQQGYSQRQIAAMVELSQSTVQRILSGPMPDNSDPDGVLAEFNGLAKAAQSENSLDAFRHVHQVALTCHANGYDVPWHSLPYLMLLSATEVEANAADRKRLRMESSQVYQDMKDWKNRE